MAWSTSTHRAAPICMSCLINIKQVTACVARFFFQQIGGKLSYTINRRLHWIAQWAGTQVAATTVWITSNSQLEGTIGRVANTAHTRSFITHRGHLNLLWIHIVLSTPMIYNLCRFKSRSNIENLKPTPRVTLRLGGYDHMNQQILPDSKSQLNEEVPSHQKGFRFKIQLKGSQSH